MTGPKWMSALALGLLLCAAAPPESEPADDEPCLVDDGADTSSTGLSESQLKKLKKAKSIMNALGMDPSEDGVTLKFDEEESALVGILVPLGFFSMIIGVTYLVSRNRARREEMRHETMRLAMERGLEIPAELLLPQVNRRSDLRRGLVLLSGGAGLAMMLSVLTEEAGAVGLFPMAVGAGYLGFWFLERGGFDRGPKTGA